MRQAFHIFKKDIRYLWIEIALALLAAGLLASTATFHSQGNSSTLMRDWLKSSDLSRSVIGQLIPFLLPIAWWTLIVRAIHAETLVGDLEFWPTRPYAWKSLVTAKALLILLFVNLPLLLAQILLVQQSGFTWESQAAGLLWNQVLITLTFILPVAAIAALTAGIMQFLLIVLVAVVSGLLLSLQFVRLTMIMVGSGWGPLDWWQSYYDLLLIGIAAVCILLWQYSTRRARTARLFGAAVVVIFALGAPFSWTSAFAMQSRFSKLHVDSSTLHAGFFTNFKFTARALINRDGTVSLHIPLELSGIPTGMTAKPEGLTYTLVAPGGAVWRGGHVSATGQLISLQDTMDGSVYQKVKDQPANLSGYLYLTLYGNHQVMQVPFDNRLMPVRGMGLCSATGGNGAPYFLECNSAFRPSADLVSIYFEPPNGRTADRYSPRQEPSYSPFPARLALNPIKPFATYSTFKGPLSAATIESLEPLAHVRAKIDISGLRLGDFEARLK